MVSVFISQRRAMEAQSGKQCSQGHTVRQEQSWDLNLDCSMLTTSLISYLLLIKHLTEVDRHYS